MNINNIPQDKVLHGGLSFFITLAGTLAVNNLLFGIGVAISLGIGKELYDKYVRKTEFSMGDIYADIVGIIAGASSTLLMVGGK